MGDYRNRECMFCGEWLGDSVQRPVNLAFMEHIARRPACQARHRDWARNMALDFKGD